MRLALVQMPNYGSKDENLYKSLQAIEIASKQGADLVLFPEVQLTEFFSQYPGQDAHKYAVTIEGETVKKLCDICRNNKISAVPNLYLLENDRTYDASIFFLLKFEIYKNGSYIGCLSKEFSFLTPHCNIDYKGGHIDGTIMEWDYSILDRTGYSIARVSKELFHMTDTYVIDVQNPGNALDALMFVLAIDAEKCSRN